MTLVRSAALEITAATECDPTDKCQCIKVSEMEMGGGGGDGGGGRVTPTDKCQCIKVSEMEMGEVMVGGERVTPPTSASALRSVRWRWGR